MTTNIYILRLENNKWYIGKSNNLEKRIQAHMNGSASLWTKKYKPLKVEKIIKNTSSFDEDKYTMEYFAKYGIDNVRGGLYVTETLDKLQQYTIKKSLWGANDCCTLCGRKGHFVKSCKSTKDIYGEDIYEEKYQDKEDDSNDGDCDSGDDGDDDYDELIFNCRYCNKEFETQKGAIFHENIYCKNKDKKTNSNKKSNSDNKTNSNKKSNSDNKTNSNKKSNCYRCGRLGHYSNDCYAKTDIDGNELLETSDDDY
jgi:predicted GIY-YIG superfamily endonuclease